MPQSSLRFLVCAGVLGTGLVALGADAVGQSAPDDEPMPPAMGRPAAPPPAPPPYAAPAPPGAPPQPGPPPATYAPPPPPPRATPPATPSASLGVRDGGTAAGV